MSRNACWMDTYTRFTVLMRQFMQFLSNTGWFQFPVHPMTFSRKFLAQAVKDVQFHQLNSIQYGERNQREGQAWKKLRSYLQVLFVCFLNTQGLFLGKNPDLAKTQLLLRERDKGNRQTKNTLMWLGKRPKNMVLRGEKTKGLCKTHPKAF